MNKRNGIVIPISISVLVLATLAAGLVPIQAKAVSITVNCSTGATISSAIATAPPSKPLTIIVIGVCKDSVLISRDDVTIQGATPKSGINASSPGAALLGLQAAHRIIFQQLVLTGGRSGIFAGFGSSFQASNLELTNQSSNGIDVIGNSVADIGGTTVVNSGADGVNAFGGFVSLHNALIENCGQNGIDANSDGTIQAGAVTIENCLIGAKAENGGDMSLYGVTVRNSRFDGVQVSTAGSLTMNGGIIQGNSGAGVRAFWGGTIVINSGLITANSVDGVVADTGVIHIQGQSWSENVTISGNGDGVLAFQSGSISIGDYTIITRNSGDGLTVAVGSSAGTGTNVIIENNRGNGVAVRDTSLLNLGKPPGPEIINNSGWGIFCGSGPGGIAGGLTGTITGNGAGQNNCPIYS